VATEAPPTEPATAQPSVPPLALQGSQIAAFGPTAEPAWPPFMFDIHPNISDGNDDDAFSAWTDVEVAPQPANAEDPLTVPMLNPVVINSSEYQSLSIDPMNILNGTSTSSAAPSWWDGDKLHFLKEVDENGWRTTFKDDVEKPHPYGPSTAEGDWLPPMSACPPGMDCSTPEMLDPYNVNVYRPESHWASKLPSRMPVVQKEVHPSYQEVSIEPFEYDPSLLPALPNPALPNPVMPTLPPVIPIATSQAPVASEAESPSTADPSTYRVRPLQVSPAALDGKQDSFGLTPIVEGDLTRDWQPTNAAPAPCPGVVYVPDPL